MKTLGEIVSSYCVEKNIMEKTPEWYRFYHMAVDGYKELFRRSGNPDWTTKRITVTPNEAGQFPIPAGYVNYDFIGACSNGRMVQFKAQDDMCFPQRDDCGDFVAGPANRYYRRDYCGVDIYGNDVGMHMEEPGFFQIFFDEGYIVVKSGTLSIDSIKLVYQSLPEVSDGGDYIVPESFDLPIKAWLEYRDAWANSAYTSSARRRDTREEWLDRKRAAKLENNPINLVELVKSLKGW